MGINEGESNGPAVADLRSRNRSLTRGEGRSFLEYAVLRPLLFESSSIVDRSRRLFRNREPFG